MVALVAQRDQAGLAQRGQHVREPGDPFVNGLRQRYNDLDVERRSLLTSIAALDRQDAADPDQPNANQVHLLDVLPHLTVNLHRAPDELLNRLFDLTQLTVRVHYATNEATLSVTLPAENLAELTGITGIEEEHTPCDPAECGKAASGRECAS
ncbi:hypothetical protein [Kutzneria sp. NPDC052558]|uniref:hypothetical protein n=1 Tax=Kutzneria sp. NPDC052558 TaxID=3364121 RepID=UPI0037CAE48B